MAGEEDEYWEEGRGWRWDLFAHLLLSTTLVKLASKGIDLIETRKHLVGWLKKGANKFSVKTAYEFQTWWIMEEGGLVGSSCGSLKFSKELCLVVGSR